MKIKPTNLDPLSNPFDDWKCLSLSLYMTLAGYSVLVGIPVISSAWVDLLGFSEVQVGRVAGADLGGLSVGALFTSLLISNISRRVIIIIGIGLAIIANFACISITQYEYVLWLRFLAGFGSGLLTATAVSCLGACSRPAFAFNAMLFAFAFSQAAEMYFLPMLSMQNIYLTFILCFVIIVPFIGFIPSRLSEKNEKSLQTTNLSDKSMAGEDRVATGIIWLCLSAIVITYVNIGAYWTYIELAASKGNTDPTWVGSVLTWSSLCSLIGCLFATVLSNRFGLLRPLLVTLLCQSSIVGMLASGITNTNILVSVFSFNCLWIFIDVYQMSTIAKFDKTGRYSSLMPGAQGLGQIVGPNLAALILGFDFGYQAVFIMCSVASIIAFLIYLFVFFKFKSSKPELAYSF